MGPIDWNALLQQMIAAAEGLGISAWVDVEPYAQGEFQKYLNNLSMISQLLDTSQITAAQASILDQMQRNSMQAVFCTLEGIGLLVAEQLINTAINVISTAVNTAIGFALL